MRRGREAEPSRALSLVWEDTRRQNLQDEAWEVTLLTGGGSITTRYHRVPGARAGVVWVGGARGGLSGPARGLYPAACERLQAAGVAGLRLDYRRPNQLEECVLDTLLGVEFLAGEGIEQVALVGHSFGGAVVIAAGALSKRVRAVVPISTQTAGTSLAPDVSPRPMLLIHGDADSVLPDTYSRDVYDRAGEPKELVIYPGAGHDLDEAREEVLDLLVRWLPEHLEGDR